MALIGVVIAFVTGGFGALAEGHLMDPGLALALGTVISGALGEIARRHIPTPKA